MARDITDAIRRLLGWETPCSRVQARLYAYAWCEPDLSEAECTEIMRHLAVCECCRAEFEEIEATIDAAGPLLYPDDALPPFDVEAMAKSIAERIDRGDTGREIALVQEFMQGCEPRFADESPYRGLCQGAFAWLGAHKRLAAMAACVLLLVAGPVLAHVAGAVRGCFSDAEDPIETGEQVALHRETLAVPELPRDAVKPAETDASAAAREIDSDITDSLDAELARQAARAEIEAMLPHTEAEYEAWARREYPHIMWLHDVLQGETPKTPPDSPAGRLVSFGMTDDGNPTITLPDAEGNKVTLCAVFVDTKMGTVPGERGETGVSPFGPCGASTYLGPGYAGPGQKADGETIGLPATIYLPIDQNTIPWDGVPANIPEWAQRLYADTPETERPTGWRALLIYSGEIFKFDWPETLDDPNCIPTSEAIHWALPIGDAAAIPPDNTEADTFANAQPLSPNDPYITALARDLPRARIVVQYIHVSALLTGTRQSAGFLKTTEAFLVRFCSGETGECATASPAQVLVSLLMRRNAQVVCAMETRTNKIGK